MGEGHGLRVAVYAISKDESRFVDRWMDSMAEADEIVVHKLAEIAADCAWCEREYGEATNARA